MPTTVPQGTRGQSLLIGVGIIFAGLLGMALALHLWSLYPAIDAPNWVSSTLSGLATLWALAWLVVSRVPFKNSWPIVLLGVIYTVTAFFWGIKGWVVLIIAGIAIAKLASWCRRSGSEP